MKIELVTFKKQHTTPLESVKGGLVFGKQDVIPMESKISKTNKRVNCNAKRRRTLKENQEISTAAKPLRPQKTLLYNLSF